MLGRASVVGEDQDDDDVRCGRPAQSTASARTRRCHRRLRLGPLLSATRTLNCYSGKVKPRHHLCAEGTGGRTRGARREKRHASEENNVTRLVQRRLLRTLGDLLALESADLA